MKRTNAFCKFAALLPLLGTLGPANAAMVFDNGSINDYWGAHNISHDQYSWCFISDSFTLTEDATIRGAQVAITVSFGAQPTALHWEVGTSWGASDIGSGDAKLADGTLYNEFWKDIPGSGAGYESSFNLNMALTRGTTYYLTLSGAQDSSGGLVYWQSSGGGTAHRYYHWYDVTYKGGISEDTTDSIHAFQLYDSPVPEPSTWIAGALLLAPCGVRLFRRHAWRL